VTGCKWVLTWFSHNMKNEKEALLRIWDFLVASRASMIIFLSSAIILKYVDYLDDENLLEASKLLQGIKFDKKELDESIQSAIALSKEYTSCKFRVGKHNLRMLREYASIMTIAQNIL